MIPFRPKDILAFNTRYARNSQTYTIYIAGILRDKMGIVKISGCKGGTSSNFRDKVQIKSDFYKYASLVCNFIPVYKLL